MASAVRLWQGFSSLGRSSREANAAVTSRHAALWPRPRTVLGRRQRAGATPDAALGATAAQFGPALTGNVHMSASSVPVGHVPIQCGAGEGATRRVSVGRGVITPDAMRLWETARAGGLGLGVVRWSSHHNRQLEKRQALAFNDRSCPYAALAALQREVPGLR